MLSKDKTHFLVIGAAALLTTPLIVGMARAPRVKPRRALIECTALTHYNPPTIITTNNQRYDCTGHTFYSGGPGNGGYYSCCPVYGSTINAVDIVYTQGDYPRDTSYDTTYAPVAGLDSDG